jgi:hypothetical protein
MIGSPVACGVAPLVTLAATPALACSSCGCTLTSDALSQGIGSQPGTASANDLPSSVVADNTDGAAAAAGNEATASIRIKAVRTLNIVKLSHAPPRRAITHLLQKV